MARPRNRCNFAIAAQSCSGDIASRSHSQSSGGLMRHVLPIAAALLLTFAAVAHADVPSVPISLKNNQFQPDVVQIPAGVKVKLVVHNGNPSPSEFESTQLHREKVVGPGQEITVYVGPLDPGSYEFFDDFHPQVRGRLVAK
jgi:plastocyanin